MTFGTASFDSKHNKWELRLEPHVALRLKRVFASVNPSSYGVITISATEENCRELIWFMQRYPLEVDRMDIMEDRASKYQNRLTLLESLLKGVVSPTEVKLKLPLRDYQSLALQVWKSTEGMLLGDDLGLGKTAVAIAGMTDPSMRPSLVLVQTFLAQQWKEEINKFTDLKVHILEKSSPYDIVKKCGSFPDAIISTYHKIHGWVEILDPIIKSIIIDECQELRRGDSKKYKACMHLARNAKYRLGLSATPIFNYGGEIFNVMDVLAPGRLGTQREFNQEWCNYGGTHVTLKDSKTFGHYMRREGLMLRRTRKEVSKELPSVSIIPHHISSDPKALEEIKGQATELAKLIIKQDQDFKGQKFRAAGEFDLKIRQATGIGKAPFVSEFVKMMLDDGEDKILLLGWHRAVYDIYLQELKEYNPMLFTGSETSVGKEKAKQAFIHGDCRVLIMSLGSGAGLNGLQDVCKIAVFGELAWSHAIHDQIIGRLNRDKSDGSKCDPVTAYFLISNEGSDPVMVDILGIKKEQAEGIRDPDAALVTKVEVNPDHMRKMAEDFLSKHSKGTT